MESIVSQVENALIAFDKAEFDLALELLKPLVAQGNETAIFYLGKMYRYGLGVVRDYEKAHELWSKLPPEDIDAVASAREKYSYWHAVQFEETYSYWRAAQSGNAEKMERFANLLRGIDDRECEDQELDHEEALHYLRLAADAGSRSAQLQLVGGAGDFEDRFKWSSILAAEGPAWVKCALGLCYLYGPSEIKNIDLGLNLLKDAADNDDWDAQQRLAEFYEKGDFVPQDFSEQAKYLHKLANIGSKDKPNERTASARFKLAQMYEKGIGVEADLYTAADFYWEAGTDEAKTSLERLYKEQCDKQGPGSISSWCSRFARMDVKDACFDEGCWHLKQTNRDKYLSRAFHCFHKAALLGHENASEFRTMVLSKMDNREKRSIKDSLGIRPKNAFPF